MVAKKGEKLLIIVLGNYLFRSSHSQMLEKLSISKISQNLQENTCVEDAFCEFCESFKNKFLQNISRQLLLTVI